MFRFLKKKKHEAEEEIELPPPPAPPADLTAPSAPEEEEVPVEFPEIKPGFPDFPSKEMPEEKAYVEDIHEAELPRLPEHPTLAEPEFPEIKPDFTPEKVFDRTIEEVIKKPEEIVRPQEVKPMFVSVDDFKNLAANTNFVRSKLIEAEEYLQRLTDLKNQELNAFDKWRKTLENVENKLSYVDKVIAEAQG